jgi:hypothetical protein
MVGRDQRPYRRSPLLNRAVVTCRRRSDAPSRDGAVFSSTEIAVMAGSEGAASSGSHGLWTAHICNNDFAGDNSPGPRRRGRLYPAKVAIAELDLACVVQINPAPTIEAEVFPANVVTLREVKI